PFYFADMPGKLLAIKPANSSGKSEESTGKTIVGGGTDLFVQRWESLLESSPVFVNDGDISAVITEADGKIVIGAAATVTDFMESGVIKKYYPVIQEKLHLFGSLPIRNRATIAGNIVNASPIADMVNILMTLNASLILKNSAGTLREIPLRKFYLGYKNLAKAADEIIIAILTDVPKGNYTYNYEKVSRREYLDIASVNSTMYAELQSGLITTAAISAGGVAPVTKYLENASAFLKGKTPSQVVLFETVAIALNEVTPISDARGSAEYKKILLSRLIKAHFLIMFAEKLQVEAVL
ncbi:MAG: FAD binding domain-containing protein, partial [Ignavibacteriales bacterium]|nr:FAD binding domain-containing protein [Ignavibacteriales bacterium]